MREAESRRSGDARQQTCSWLPSAAAARPDACRPPPAPPYPAEVVVAPAAVHIPQVLSSLRKDFSVAAQNCWVKKGGAFTGELRWDTGWGGQAVGSGGGAGRERRTGWLAGCPTAGHPCLQRCRAPRLQRLLG